MNSIKQWISEKEFSFHRIETLIVILFSSTIFLIKILIPFIKEYIDHWSIPVVLFFLTYIIIIAYWYYERAIFPKNKIGKEHIIIAIITENAKQKTRITNDFAKQIKKQIIERDLDLHYDITVLHNYQSTIIQKRLQSYMEALKANLKDSPEITKFDKLLKKLNGKFIIYGDLIQRNSGESTYCFSIDGMINHKQTTIHNGNIIQDEFLKLWEKEIIFLEKEELTGFRSNAENIFFTATYMLGLATFVDNSYAQGIKIWEGLEEYINDNSELSDHLTKVIQLKSSSYLIYSRFLYHQGDIAESMYYRGKFLELIPNEYDSYLTEAINQLTNKYNPELSLELVHKASKIAPQDEQTWRYNEFYLYILLDKPEEALSSLDKILETSYRNEIEAINQVISYNKKQLKEDESHYQTYFIIGVLLYKKRALPLEAYGNLESFISLAENMESYQPLVQRARNYVSEIDNIIGVEI